MKNVLCVKSIMTILITIMLCVMTYLYPESYSEVFKNVAIMVATFYFSHQISKSKGDVNNGNNTDISDSSDGNSSSDIRKKGA